MNDSLFLLVENPTGDRSTISLEPDAYLFAGSGSGCHVPLCGTNISPIHCMIWMESDDTVHVQDKDTTGQTMMNGKPIKTAPMVLGDELTIGEYRLSLTTNEVTVNATSFIQEPPSQECADVATATDTWSTNNEAAEPMSNESVYEPEEVMPEPAAELETQEDTAFAPPSPAPSPENEGWDFDFAPEEDTWDAMEGESNCQENEVQMLRMEVEQLRFELAERDAQMTQMDQPVDCDHEESHAPETEKLVMRLEELLDELQGSDDRVQQLEELLRLSDTATEAEKQERQQLENWVGEIEDRVSQRESESVAELERANQQLQFSQKRIQDLETRIDKVLNSSDHVDSGAVKEFQQQLQRAQAQYQQVNEENLQLKSQLEEQQRAVRAEEEFETLQQKLLEMEVNTSRERAEMARQRAELEKLRHELEESSKSRTDLEDSNSRVRAMRLHLREVHEQEQKEKKERSLGARISRLLSRTSRKK